MARAWGQGPDPHVRGQGDEVGVGVGVDGGFLEGVNDVFRGDGWGDGLRGGGGGGGGVAAVKGGGGGGDGGGGWVGGVFEGGLVVDEGRGAVGEGD